jgi:hypothetical protein
MASTRSGSQLSYDLDIAKRGLRYPLEDHTQSQEKFPGYIRFDAIRQYTKQSPGGSGANLSTTEGLLDAAEANLQSVTQGNSMKIREGSVTLYMPPGFEIQDGVEYDNVNLGLLGQMAKNGITRGNEVGVKQAIQEGAKNALKQAGSFLEGAASASGGELIRNILTTTGANMTPLRGVSEGIRSGAQVRANPNTQSVFQGVAMRSFGFNFSMMPTSAKEAQTIEEIVKFFRTAMYPMKAQEYFYKFPVKFEVKMFYNGRLLKPRLLPCFLTSATTSFNGETGTFHKDGSYTQTNLALSFQEERTLSALDIGKDDY